MSWVFVGAAVVTALEAVASGRQQQAAAQSEANMQEYNDKVSEIQARQAQAAASNQQDEQRRRARQQIGLQLAASAEAGAGLNPDLLRQSIFDMEADTQAIRYEGSLRAQGLNEQAELGRSGAAVSRDRGRAAVQGSYLTAAGSLLSGYGGAGYYSAQRTAALNKTKT